MKYIYILSILLISFLNQPVLYGQKKMNASVPQGHQLYKSLKIKQNQNKTQLPSKVTDKATDRFYYELDRTCDPLTRKIPKDIHKKEALFAKNSKSLGSLDSTSKKSGSNWINRGPYNVGGRTRALAVDMTNENVILAGGVSGGLWRSDDGGQNWNKVTRKFQNPSITAIVQDPRPGFQHIWYYAGGERLGNSANLNAGGFYTGAGIYKSQDGGRTFEVLSSTTDGTVNAISQFDLVNSIAINPTNGDLYIATFFGVHRSQDGGASFQEVLASGADNRTEIIVSSTGKFYASVATSDRASGVTGVYFSEDGTTWTRIMEDAFSLIQYNRIICALNPSNEKELYVFVNEGRAAPTNFLYRYNAENNTYENLSRQLPSSRNNPPVGGLNTQLGYNMVLAVHPTNPDFIIIGGTNLFRTTDGFRTNIEEVPNHWIGGYSPLNDVSLYKNSHPDMHAIAFFPSNPDKVLNGNDGGIFVTNDITASNSFEEPVNWVSLNNGYITTQPYAVSFDPKSESDELLAGFQDNGTWHTNQTNITSFWEEQFGGDGSYNAIADNGRTRYASSQRGNILRFNYDEDGNAVSVAWVRPAIGSNFSFITPFILDPNDDNVMYMPAGRTLIRNSNLDEIPSFESIEEITSPADINWTEITQTASIQDANRRELNNITALDVSTFPEANKLYYGTGQGQVYRLDHADLPSSEPMDIFTGKGLPENGFVSSIHVDPNNSNRVVVSFSNYNIQSIFYTKDAGENWIDISGNLEDNKDGTGNGPSVRWVSFLGNKDGVLAGTSTGLYYTDRISQENTVWRLENNQIGEGIVMQIRTRKDGMAALAVHGNGVFSKKFNVTPPGGEKTLFVNRKPDDIILSIKETPQSITLDLSDIFKEESGLPIHTTIESSDKNREFIGYEFVDDKLQIFFFATNSNVPKADKEGEAVIRITGTSGIQKLATEFKVQVFQKPILKRLDVSKPVLEIGLPSSQATDFITGDPLYIETADTFRIPEGNTWILERMKINAVNDPFSGLGFSTPGNEARIRIYKDQDGEPGEQIADMVNSLRANPVLEVFEVGEFDFVFPETVQLDGGIYWISFSRIEEFYFFENIIWLQQNRLPDSTPFDNQEGEPVFADKADPHIRAAAGQLSSNTLSEEWISNNDRNGFSLRSQLVFSLFGEVENFKNRKSENTNEKIDIALYPNPTNSNFDIKFNKKPSERIHVKVLDISGKKIFTKTFDENQNKYSINTENWFSGIYIIRVTSNNTEVTSKIVISK